MRPAVIGSNRAECAIGGSTKTKRTSDEPRPTSVRGVIERNSMGLLSNYRRPVLDPASPNWLGSYCDRERVPGSGLWNNNHVDEGYDPAFLDVLESHAKT
jgi:hypothetical protein